MAKIEFRLSQRVGQDGMAEVMVRFFAGKVNQRARSEIYVSPDFFEYYIDRSKSEKEGVRVPAKSMTATVAEAEKFGFVLRDSGEIVASNRRLTTPDVVYHQEQEERAERLKKAILDAFKDADQTRLSNDWLRTVVDEFNHPERHHPTEVTIYDYMETYLKKKKGDGLSVSYEKGFRNMVRDLQRYEDFIRMTERGRKDYAIGLDTFTKDDAEGFIDYLRNEHDLAEEYPKTFAKLMALHPICDGKRSQAIQARGENTITILTKKLKSFFRWCVETERTTNDPFKGVKIAGQHYGTPYYITIGERNQIADFDIETAISQMSSKDLRSLHLSKASIEAQRDIFVFQCFVGCRVSDLIRLTDANVDTDNGILFYTPIKTKDEDNSAQARVPLHEKAMAILKKYHGVDKHGRILPFVSPERYNVAIKVIFTLAGITRKVEVRNPKTGENEMRPINEIASSHLARRTFVGNAYLKVSDPNIIGSMSGHAEGSRAFSRYRRIEDKTRWDVINQIG